MYQQVSIPSNATSVVLYFDASINTAESGNTPYDGVEIQILNTSGSLLQSLGTLNNTHGDAGVSSCQTWDGYYANIPNTYWGSTVRIAFEFSTDGSLPTIFRIDDVELLVSTSNCNYSVSPSAVTLGDPFAGTFSNVASVTAGSGCAWTASVTSGSSWLSTSSSGSGNGTISVTVTENPGSSDRVGSIDVAGQTLVITQPGYVCEYTVSPELYQLPDHEAGTHSNIAIINTGDGCPWDADVLEGSSWLITNSNGSGSGTISVTVLENNSATARSGSLIIEGETLLILQPANPWLTGIGEEKVSNQEFYPNPTTGLVNYTLSENSAQITYQVMDIHGGVVRIGSALTTAGTLDITDLEAGVYLVSFRDENGIIDQKRLIKQ